MPAHPGTTGTDMGSGLFPWEGFQRAAYIRNLKYQANPAGTPAAYPTRRRPSSISRTNRFKYEVTNSLVAATHLAKL